MVYVALLSISLLAAETSPSKWTTAPVYQYQMVRMEIVIMFFNVVGLAPIAFIAKLVSNWNTRTQSTR